MSTTDILLSAAGAIGVPGVGQKTLIDTTTESWVVPSNVTSISAVCIGGGGGGRGDGSTGFNGAGGGALAYANNIAVTPGETLTLTVGAGGLGGSSTNATSGGDTSIKRGATNLVLARGGSRAGTGGQAASCVGDVAYSGGNGGSNLAPSPPGGAGGGGAGGYAGAGGKGGNSAVDGTSGTGGSAGGGAGSTNVGYGGGGGGGVGILGEGASGSGGTTGTGGGGGNAGSATQDSGGKGAGGGSTNGGSGGAWGGGGASPAASDTNGGAGGGGALRIIWGTGRSFPSTNVIDKHPFSTALLINGEGGVIADSSGCNQPLTAVGNVAATTAQKYFGSYGLAFDGSGDYIATGGSVMLHQSQPFCLDCRVRWTDTGTSTTMGVIASQYLITSDNPGGRMLFGSQSGDLVLRVDGSTVYLTTPVSINTWYHVALTWDGTTMRLFKDGALAASSTTVPQFQLKPLDIGGSADSGISAYSLNGYLDEIRVVIGSAVWTSAFTPPANPY